MLFFFLSCLSSYLPAGSARRAALPVLFLLTADFRVFRPAGATRCTDQGQIWQGGVALPAKFHFDRCSVSPLRGE